VRPARSGGAGERVAGGGDVAIARVGLCAGQPLETTFFCRAFCFHRLKKAFCTRFSPVHGFNT
jgi:hypothetical protein